ncbi:unnamed protein product [Lota lota]
MAAEVLRLHCLSQRKCSSSALPRPVAVLRHFFVNFEVVAFGLKHRPPNLWAAATAFYTASLREKEQEKKKKQKMRCALLQQDPNPSSQPAW